MDALQKMSETALTDCPSCGEPRLQRLLSAPRFRLKGQGWYETDFKKDKQRNIAGDTEPAKKDDSKVEASKSDNKAPATEAKKEKQDTPKPANDSKKSTA
jgi:putative FmdB family regulatory protein